MGVWADTDTQNKNGYLGGRLGRWQREEVLLYPGGGAQRLLDACRVTLGCGFYCSSQRGHLEVLRWWWWGGVKKVTWSRIPVTILKNPFIRNKINLAGCPPLPLPSSVFPLRPPLCQAGWNRVTGHRLVGDRWKEKPSCPLNQCPLKDCSEQD